MKSYKTDKQLDGLIIDVLAVPRIPPADHLSLEEYIGYTLNTVTGDKLERVENHVAACPICAENMEFLMAFFSVWRTDTAKRIVAALLRRLQSSLSASANNCEAGFSALKGALSGLSDGFFIIPAPIPAPIRLARSADVSRGERGITSGPSVTTTAQLISEGQLLGSLLFWHVQEDPSRESLIVCFTSKAMELDGAYLRLNAGEWKKNIVMTKATAHDLGAEIVIPALERAHLPAGQPIHVQLVIPESQEISDQ